MIVFIVPLKSSKVSKSWELTSYLFERNLISICGQTSDFFRVIVVCNEKPITKFNSPFVEYIQTNLPTPTQDWYGRNQDKSKKLMIGLEKSKHFNPSHIMAVDADDLISNKIAAFVRNRPEKNGWILNKGYAYEPTAKLLYDIRKNFVFYCGTSIIIKYDLFELLFEENIYRHKGTTLASHGIVLPDLPFYGAIYNSMNGENVYAVFPFYERQFFKGNFISITFSPIQAQTRKEFGLYEK